MISSTWMPRSAIAFRNGSVLSASGSPTCSTRTSTIRSVRSTFPCTSRPSNGVFLDRLRRSSSRIFQGASGSNRIRSAGAPLRRRPRHQAQEVRGRAGQVAQRLDQAHGAVVVQLERDRQHRLEPDHADWAWAKGTRLLSWSCGAVVAGDARRSCRPRARDHRAPVVFGAKRRGEGLGEGAVVADRARSARSRCGAPSQVIAGLAPWRGGRHRPPPRSTHGRRGSGAGQLAPDAGRARSA